MKDQVKKKTRVARIRLKGLKLLKGLKGLKLLKGSKGLLICILSILVGLLKLIKRIAVEVKDAQSKTKNFSVN